MSDHPPPPPYGPPGGYPPGGYQPGGYPPYAPPDHPQSTTVLVLGVLGLVLCQVLSPVAWVMGNRVVREIDASAGRVGGRGAANVGRICGLVGTVILAFSLVALVLVFVLAFIGLGVSWTSSVSSLDS